MGPSAADPHRRDGVLVWTGRLVDAWPGGRDGWSLGRDELRRLLGRARVFVMIDPVSVPWPTVAQCSDVPVVALLPQDLDADALSDLLGTVLFETLSPWDRLLDPRADVRRELTARWGLHDDVWLPWSSVDGSWKPVLDAVLADDPEIDARARGKERWLQPRRLAGRQLATALSGEAWTGVRPRVALAGEAREWGPALERAARAEVRPLEHYLDKAEDAFPVPRPDACVVALRDGGQGHSERVALLTSADTVLGPGGVLLVVAHVVDTDAGVANPRVSTLIEEIHEATGTAVHLDEIVSARWVGDRYARGVLLRFTSLKVRAA